MMFDVSILFLVVPLVMGLFLGFFLRRKKKVDLNKVTVGVIVALIFSLGFSIGSNNVLLESLPRVGLGSLVVALLAVVFSVVFVVLVRRRVRLP